MKRKMFLMISIIFISILLCLNEGLCQFIGNKPYIAIVTVKNYPKKLCKGELCKDGVYFMIDLWGTGITSAKYVKKITVTNTDIDIDSNTYQLPLTPQIYNMVLQYLNLSKFNGQYGTYEVEVEKVNPVDNSSYFEYMYSDYLDDGIIPFPALEGLKVSFKSGNTTPTFGFKTPDIAVNYAFWDIKIYDKELTRRIYTSGNLPPLPPGNTATITFPVGRNGNCTGEDLIPGETYLFRAGIYYQFPGEWPPNTVMAATYLYFTIPKK